MLFYASGPRVGTETTWIMGRYNDTSTDVWLYKEGGGLSSYHIHGTSFHLFLFQIVTFYSTSQKIMGYTTAHAYNHFIVYCYTLFNDNTPHSEQRRTVLIRQTVHAQTRASSFLI